MKSTELLSQVRSITLADLDVLNVRFVSLSDQQLKWKSNESSWSIQEVFAHLNKFAIYYHDTFKKCILKTRFKTPSENFISSPLGRSAWASMKLGNAYNVKRKFKAQRLNNPMFEKSLISGNDTADLINHLNDLNYIFDLSSTVNIRKVKIPISISKIIRFRLGDALLYVVFHNQRHIQQAINILNHSKFPKQ
jgi:hypothetical protein